MRLTRQAMIETGYVSNAIVGYWKICALEVHLRPSRDRFAVRCHQSKESTGNPFHRETGYYTAAILRCQHHGTRADRRIQRQLCGIDADTIGLVWQQVMEQRTPARIRVCDQLIVQVTGTLGRPPTSTSAKLSRTTRAGRSWRSSNVTAPFQNRLTPAIP